MSLFRAGSLVALAVLAFSGQAVEVWAQHAYTADT